MKKYHIYGDNSGKLYTWKELKYHFKQVTTDYLQCIKDFKGNPENQEYFTFNKNQFIQLRMTSSGNLELR